MENHKIIHADCSQWLRAAAPGGFHLSFVDPPFNQGKHYRCFDDKQDNAVYWRWMGDVLSSLRRATAAGGAVYFMQREKNGGRFHKQQSPLALLARIILSSTNPDDVVFDPFAGTALVATRGLGRRATGVEIDPQNVARIKERLAESRMADDIYKYRQDYSHTDDLDKIWAADDGFLCVQKSDFQAIGGVGF